jgi:hAT family C-terminal dimerisation region
MSSAECERIFSSAKLLVTSSRNRLRPDIIEASECLRNWLDRSGEPNSTTETGSQDPQRLQTKGKAVDSVYLDNDEDSDEEETDREASNLSKWENDKDSEEDF